MSSKKNKLKPSDVAPWGKIRGDWGGISPITKVIPNKKKPKRKSKHPKQTEREE